MKLVDELFKKYTLIEDKLIPYGFTKKGDSYCFNHSIHNDDFDLQIIIENGALSARLIDNEFGDEYSQINVESASGGFIASLKEECSDLLIDIRNKCFKEEYFISNQANRIAELIKEKYDIAPEFMKFGKATNAVFRNPNTRKWAAMIMAIKRNKIVGESDELVEGLNMNFKKDALSYNGKGIYHPYKKKNTNWIVIILDDTLPDNEVMKLIDIGYNYSNS